MMNAYAHQRQYDRYYIGQVPGLSAFAMLGNQQIRIATLSAGGCGFLQKRGQYDNEPSEVIACEIQAGDLGSIQVKAKVIYIRTVSILNDDAHYYGLRFDDSEVAKISNFIERLLDSDKGPHVFLV